MHTRTRAHKHTRQCTQACTHNTNIHNNTCKLRTRVHTDTHAHARIHTQAHTNAHTMEHEQVYMQAGVCNKTKYLQCHEKDTLHTGDTHVFILTRDTQPQQTNFARLNAPMKGGKTPRTTHAGHRKSSRMHPPQLLPLARGSENNER